MTLDPVPYRDAPGLAAVLAALPGTRLVGGCVRDALAGVPSADIDLATPWRPEAVVQALERAAIRVIPTGLAHGTVTALSDGHTYEVTTLRRDVETDGRHATVAFTDDWAEDAARRDFTINAMSMTPDGAVFDYFHGAEDLAAGRVRFVGRAEDRVREDYLRILRFFRFWTRYGRGEPDADAVAAIAANVDGLDRLSIERVTTELMLVLRAPEPKLALRLMRALGVLSRVLGGSADEYGQDAVERAGAVGPDPLLRFAALTLRSDSVSAARQLKMSGADQNRIIGWTLAQPLATNATDADIRRELATLAPLVFDAHDAALGRIDLEHPGDAGWCSLKTRVSQTPVPKLPVRGRDLIAMGVPPGPEHGRLLLALTQWWLEGGCVADADACRAELARRLAG